MSAQAARILLDPLKNAGHSLNLRGTKKWIEIDVWKEKYFFIWKCRESGVEQRMNSFFTGKFESSAMGTRGVV